MVHANNVKIIKAFKLFTGMEDFNAKYHPEKVYNDSKQSKSNNNFKTKAVQKTPKLLIVFPFYIIKSNFDSLCTLCIGSKQTQVVNHSKLMTKVKKKLKEIHVNL